MDLSVPPSFPRVAIDVPPELADDACCSVFELGASGVEVRDQTTLERASAPETVTMLVSFLTNEDAVEAIKALPSAWNPRRDDVIGDTWRDSWKEHFHPFHLTEQIVVRPPWEPFEPGHGEHVLEMDPGRAFGTGLHATTRLVAHALQKDAHRFAGKEVLDVGCGTGVLSLCALVLGAQRALAVDNDPDAISATRENAERNKLGSRVSVRCDNTIAWIDKTFPVVVANIEATVLISMAEALCRAVAPGGLLILSGILKEQAEQVSLAFAALVPIEVSHDSGWVAIAFDAACDAVCEACP